MILIINTCKEKLHYYEFVLPIEDILKNGGVKFVTLHYSKLKPIYLNKADKIIICGTSLKDNQFIDGLSKFSWLKTFEKPILGICAGCQIIGLVFGGKVKKKSEIGFYFEDFRNIFLGLLGKHEVWHLHNNFVDFKKLKDFKVFSEEAGIVQAVTHKSKEIYGVLFHPEVRQKEMILNFISK